LPLNRSPAKNEINTLLVRRLTVAYKTRIISNPKIGVKYLNTKIADSSPVIEK
jgi:hypothetical protein